MQRKNLPKNSQKYIAIDSNILRPLIFLDKIKQKFDKIDFQKCSDPLLRMYGKHFLRLYKYILEDKIRIVILPTVFAENKHIQNFNNFIVQYCYFTKDFMAIDKQKDEEINNLAMAYCKPYEYNGIIYDAPMQAKYNRYAKQMTPTNDCYIMAEATIENCSLITANGKDFIFDPRNSLPGKRNNDRAKGISIINKLNLYYETMPDGHIITPHPFNIHLLGTIIQNGIEPLNITTPYQKNLIEAKDLDLELGVE